MPAPPAASAVLVAIRVRPFNEREKTRNVQPLVRMPAGGKITELRDPTGREVRRFTFDHSYWSHDGFRVLDNGYFAPAPGSHYADQHRLFNDLGQQVLANAWAGYNCTLFAYGQTGSGKSYSILGFGPNQGIVPQLCDHLFRGIAEQRAKQPDAEFQVSISMLEIYCEKVRDLLGDKAVLKGALKVREHPRDGFYVEGLSRWPVDSYRQVARRIAEGTRARTIAATNMNETSSRAHTIVRLLFSQKTAKGRTKQSELNLVDLAGSERQKGATPAGDRLREGIRINQSLSALGRVIRALHEREQSVGGTSQVPYRDSVLTSLLRNALGGNSKTIMLAAISPADFEETLSTLRFADRVKQIKTRPVVNETQTEKLVRALREENGRLLEVLHRGGLDGVATQEELEALRRQLAENQQEMERLEKSWSQREEALKKQISSLSLMEEDRLEQKRKEVPHLWNLNEDPALTNVIVHFVEIGESRVGSGAAKADKLQIVLKGLSILPEHALLRNVDNKKITLTPLGGAQVLVNGVPINADTELQQNDRVHFGGNHLYVFVNPRKKGVLPVERISFDMAQKEIARAGHLVGDGANGKNSKAEEEMVLEEELVRLLPYVYRANSMAKELDKDVSFEIVLLPPETKGVANGVTEVWVKVKDAQTDTTHLWDSSRFMSRYYGMQEVYQNKMEGAQPAGLMLNEKDPFYEPTNSLTPLGTATVFLQNLAFLVEMDEQVPIIDLHGEEAGHLSLSFRPCTSSGREIVGEYVERSEQLIGKNLGIKVKLNSAIGLPRRVEQSSCKYRFYDQPQVCTPLQSGQNPVYADERIFLYKPITQQLLDYLTESALVIEVLAIQRDRKHPIIDSLSNEFIHPNKESHALKEQKISAGNKVAFKKRISNKNTSLENVKHIGRGSLQLQSKSYDQSPKSPTAGRTFVKRYSTSQIEEGISKEGTHQKNIPPRRKN